MTTADHFLGLRNGADTTALDKGRGTDANVSKAFATSTKVSEVGRHAARLASQLFRGRAVNTENCQLLSCRKVNKETNLVFSSSNERRGRSGWPSAY